MTHSRTLLLSHPDLADTVTLLRRVGADLDRQREVVARQVDSLLDGGWSGAAAHAYREGWEVWHAGCVEVLAALHTMTDLMVEAGGELDATDDGVRAALSTLTAQLSARLVERLR